MVRSVIKSLRETLRRCAFAVKARRKFLKIVHKPLKPQLKKGNIKVDQKPKTLVSQLKVADDLCFMNF